MHSRARHRHVPSSVAQRALTVPGPPESDHFQFWEARFESRNPVPDGQYTLLTLRKGLQVLEALGASSEDLTLTEVAQQVGEPATVVFRILKTFGADGYVR